MQQATVIARSTLCAGLGCLRLGASAKSEVVQFHSNALTHAKRNERGDEGVDGRSSCIKTITG